MRYGSCCWLWYRCYCCWWWCYSRRCIHRSPGAAPLRNGSAGRRAKHGVGVKAFPLTHTRTQAHMYAHSHSRTHTVFHRERPLTFTFFALLDTFPGPASHPSSCKMVAVDSPAHFCCQFPDTFRCFCCCTKRKPKVLVVVVVRERLDVLPSCVKYKQPGRQSDQKYRFLYIPTDSQL